MSYTMSCLILCHYVLYYVIMSYTMSLCPIICLYVLYYVIMSYNISLCPILCQCIQEFLRLNNNYNVIYSKKKLGEPEHVDSKENLFNALTQVTNGASVDLNPRPVDLQSATLTTRPLRST